MSLENLLASHPIRNWILQLESASSISEVLKKAFIYPIVIYPIAMVILLFPQRVYEKIGHEASAANLLLRLSGLKFNIPDRESFNIIFCWEPWMPKYVELSCQSVAIDIGAHVGKYTVQWAKICKKVLAFEPDPVNFKYLMKNIRLNRIEKRAKAFSMALSNFNGYYTLYRSKRSQNHSLIPNLSSSCIGKYKVKVGKLDEMLINADINQVDLVKIDVEGAELAVLQGSKSTLKQFKPQLIVEVSHKSREAVVKFLTSLGYDVRVIPESETHKPLYLNATTKR